MTALDEALAKGQAALTEHAATQFLSEHGIPVPREALVSSADAAVDAAARLGFPVVVKASGVALQHKTEVGGIALNLRSVEEVQREGRRLAALPGCDGLLVAEMVPGEREFACGLTRDPQFGPCVMFGLGGIFTEVLRDVSFRVAPLTELDAEEMLDEIQTRKILSEFRGSPAVDRKALVKALIGIGNLGLEHEEINEIDINPLIIDGSRPVAVDALVILRSADKAKTKSA
jgi:succinyl-CoA synthetase beta subunit